MQQPLDQFSPEEIKKNSIIALYANEAEDNNGLPFFLGKVLRVFNKNEENDDDDDDEGQSDQKAPEYVVKLHEYIQTEVNQQPTGKYIAHNRHGEKKKGSKTTKSEAVTSEVEIAQIAFLFESLNKDKSIPNPAMKLLSFNCEVAARRDIFVCPGWHKFAIDLGLKPMPEPDK
jgi:hypothetical protein